LSSTEPGAYKRADDSDDESISQFRYDDDDVVEEAAQTPHLDEIQPWIEIDAIQGAVWYKRASDQGDLVAHGALDKLGIRPNRNALEIRGDQ